MAYNYTVSEYVFTEAVTDAVYAGNMVSGGTMIITPNDGYVVSASSFSASGTLPGQFASIAFTDSAVAGEINNTVIITFTFSTLFEMSPGLNTITLPITGHADLIGTKRYIDFDIDFIDNTIKNLNGSSTVEKLGSAVTKTGPTTVSSVTTTNLSATNVTADYFAQIGTLTVTADDSPSICNFINPPTIELVNMPEGSVSLQLESITRRDGETDTVKIWVYKIMFISEFSITELSGAKVLINYTGVVARSTTKEIKQITFGEPEVAVQGGRKVIKIMGDVGAEFDLTITKNSNNTSIMDTNVANADIIHIPAGLLRGLNKTLTTDTTGQLFSTFEILQVFPSTSSNEIYHINVTPKNGTILNSNLEQSAPQGIIYQYVNPKITLRADVSSVNTSTTVADIVYTGRPNKRPDQLKRMKDVVEFFQIDYTLTHDGSGGGAFSKTATTMAWSSTGGTSSWTNSAYDSASTTPANHGNHIEISNIATTASGATATVKADVIVRKFGTAEVIMSLPLRTFFNS